MRSLRLVLGDQLSFENPALADLDPTEDAVLMIESSSESTAVWSAKARIAIFLSAMRHFAVEVVERGLPLVYVRLDDPLPGGFEERLTAALATHGPATLVVCEPGEWRMLEIVQRAAESAGCVLDLRDDTHFLCSRAEFATWAGSKKTLRMEFFYRWMRARLAVLVDEAGEPAGGRWNFDTENRKGFGRHGPVRIPQVPLFAPDAMTREVFTLIEDEFGDHPGSLEHFAWPVTRADALHALERFVEERLDDFGDHQDAMWTGMTFGWHAALSSSLNLKLISPREVVDAAVARHARRPVPLASLEGFIRQIVGWREFIRGVYWLDMPGMLDGNRYGYERALPRWYWTGDVGMNCMKQSIGQTLAHGYAHHIQRLMVTGQFTLLAGVRPREVADWYLAVYVDAVEWVELPNVVGMAIHALGDRFVSKPYVASGAYINRMSDYCRGCRYETSRRVDGVDAFGETRLACPVTTLYWNYLAEHRDALASNPRTRMMVTNLDRIGADELAAIRRQAAKTLVRLDEL
jgi:deoxyribodipyrimidine photolyase-related protein